MASTTNIASLFLLALSGVSGSVSGNHGNFLIRTRELVPLGHRISNDVTPYTLDLTSHQGLLASSRYLQSMRATDSGGEDTDESTGGTTAELLDTFGGQVYLADIQLGIGAPLRYVVDTGSSDTWVAQNGFECVDAITRLYVAEETCKFGPLYNTTPTFLPLANRTFNVTYADGEAINGVLGNETVTLAGIKVTSTIGLVEKAIWYGDGISSGLLGLAFPSLTSAYTNHEPSDSLDPNSEPQPQLQSTLTPYSPVFTTMHQSGLIPPLFSLALARSNFGTSTHTLSGGSILSLGGLPYSIDQSLLVSTPMKLTSLSPKYKDDPTWPGYQFYAIEVNGFAYAESPVAKVTTMVDVQKDGTRQEQLSGILETHQQEVGGEATSTAQPDVSSTSGFITVSSSQQTPSPLTLIIDSGTSFNFIPDTDASAVNGLFSPPALYDASLGVWTVECNAKPPKFGVYIQGRIFYVNAKDMVAGMEEKLLVRKVNKIDVDPGRGAGNETETQGTRDIGTKCLSTVQPMGNGLAVLGDAFLKNVLAVFDVGAAEMRFAARSIY